MSETNKKSGGSRFWLIWLLAGEVVLMGLITVMLGREAMELETRREREVIISELGYSGALWVEKVGFDAYARLFRDTGFEKDAYDVLLPSKEEVANSRGLEDLGGRLYFPTVRLFLDGSFNMIRRTFVRGAGILLWIPTLPIILIPSIIDGVMIRKKKQYTNAYMSPYVHGSTSKLIKVVAIITPLYLMTPAPITTYVIPISFILISWMIRTMISHTMKRI